MGTAVIALLCLTLIAPHPALAQGPTLFRIGTGSTAGTYYPIGALIAAAISRPPGSAPCGEGGACGVDNLIATAVTSRGSFDNIQGIAEGRFNSGLSQADIAAWAYAGHPAITGTRTYPELRAIANLYPEHVHLVVRRHLGVQSLRDLKGLRVALDREGSGTRINTRLILSAYGLEPDDIVTTDLGPEKAISALLDHEVDAAFFVVGYPSAAVTELVETGRFTLVPIEGIAARQLVIANRYFTIGTIPASAYPGVGETGTLQVGAQWLISARTDPELVEAITAALWNPANRALLDSGHAKGRQIRLENALSGLTVPLHPGARAFYSAAGMLPAIDVPGGTASTVPAATPTTIPANEPAAAPTAEPATTTTGD